MHPGPPRQGKRTRAGVGLTGQLVCAAPGHARDPGGFAVGGPEPAARGDGQRAAGAARTQRPPGPTPRRLLTTARGSPTTARCVRPGHSTDQGGPQRTVRRGRRRGHTPPPDHPTPPRVPGRASGWGAQSAGRGLTHCREPSVPLGARRPPSGEEAPPVRGPAAGPGSVPRAGKAAAPVGAAVRTAAPSGSGKSDTGTAGSGRGRHVRCSRPRRGAETTGQRASGAASEAGPPGAGASSPPQRSGDPPRPARLRGSGPGVRVTGGCRAFAAKAGAHQRIQPGPAFFTWAGTAWVGSIRVCSTGCQSTPALISGVLTAL